MKSANERRELLKAVYQEARGCVACPLHETRTNVVFGSGNADAELMFVGEAPGANEDLQGLPFVGQAGKLLEKLLGEIGMERGDVFIANTLECRPPGNRDPYPHELDACRHYLYSQLELIQPTVICTLGNFATKLLRGEPTGISKIHGQPEVRTIGPRAVRLYPLYHPAAALYTPSTLGDAARRLPADPGDPGAGPARPAGACRPLEPLPAAPEPALARAPPAAAEPAGEPLAGSRRATEQLGLF